MSRSMKKDAIASYSNLFISILTGITVVPIIESHIGKNYFGIYQFIFTLTAYTAIMNMGLTKTVERYVAKYAVRKEEDKESLIVSMVVSIYLMASLVLVLIISVLYMQFGNIFAFTGDELMIAKQCFLLASVNATLNIPAMSFLAHLKGRGRFFITYNFHSVYIVSRMIMVILMLNLGYGIVTVFLVDLILNQTLNLSYALFSIIKYKIKLNIFKYDKELFIKLFQFTLFVSVGSIGDLLYWNTDNIILGIMSTSDVIAEYALSQSLMTYFIRYTTAFTGLLLPRFMEKAEEVEKEHRAKHMGLAFIKATRIHGFIMSFAVVNFIVFGRDLIRVWVGNDYQMTYTYSIILLIPMWIAFSQVSGIDILYVMNEHKTRIIIYTFNAFANIFLTVLLVKLYGPIGAAISTSVTMIIGTIILLNIYYSRLFQYKLWDYFREVYLVNLLFSVLVIGLGVVFNQEIKPFISVGHEFVNLVVRGILFNILFVLVILFGWLRTSERKALLSNFNR